MDIRIKNNDLVNRTWGGKEFTPGEIYTLQQVDYTNFVTSAILFTDVGSGKALVGSLDSFFTDPIKGWEFLEHEGSDEVVITSLPELQPFALPAYRTKRNAIASPVTIAPGAIATIDFQLTAERYVSGGCIIIENAEFGDYCIAEVIDIDGVIPAPYRAALCENHPTVATYIEKEYIKLSTPGSITAGSISRNDIDTYPLNAKITVGLYLRVTYVAVNSGLNRRAVVNYYLTKKL